MFRVPQQKIQRGAQKVSSSWLIIKLFAQKGNKHKKLFPTEYYTSWEQTNIINEIYFLSPNFSINSR